MKYSKRCYFSANDKDVVKPLEILEFKNIKTFNFSDEGYLREVQERHWYIQSIASYWNGFYCYGSLVNEVVLEINWSRVEYVKILLNYNRGKW